MILLLMAWALGAEGQSRRFRGGWQRPFQVPLATAASFEGGWQFCRLAYSGRAWATDYPDADYNFSTRLSELTKTTVSRGPDGQPLPLIVRPADDALFQCPFVMIWQAESLWFSDEDAARLRQYLLKGGFIWADDFWGSDAWEHFAHEMAKVLPDPEHRFVDLLPSHPLYRMLHELPRVPQVPAINYWLGTGDTSEQGADSAVVHVRGIADAQGRVMVLATHNTAGSARGWTPATSARSPWIRTPSASTSCCTR
jgi:hypothetical protein